MNAGPVGTETLKNLILPAIGSFTVVDGATVTAEDLGNNFFVEPSDLGEPRAQVTMKHLLELNDDVKGDCVTEDATALIASERITEFVKGYTIIIATQLCDDDSLALAKVCWECNVPLFVVKVNGMVGTLRTQVCEHTVIESKPEPERMDLRLTTPFPELAKLAATRSTELEAMDNEHHAHVPWVLIVIQLVQQFREANDGKAPAFRDRSFFVEAIKKLQRNPDEENFKQAIANLRLALMPANQHIPDEVREVLGDDKAAVTDQNTNDFWVLARAVREFVACAEEGNGLLPLPGKIPDMVSDNESYIQLQRVYLAKAEADLQAISTRVARILEAVGKPATSISAGDIKLFCRNVGHLRCLRIRSIEEERAAVSPAVAEMLAEASGESSNAIWYIIMRAADNFSKTHGRAPGAADGDYAGDVEPLKEAALEVAKDVGLEDAVAGWKREDCSFDDLVTEYCRFGGSELHGLCAVMGGIISQEALKVITQQFMPMESWIAFNGMSSTLCRFAA